MDKNQIRENLASYSPELFQDGDPLFADSLLAAKADPELSAWLDEQVALDNEFTEALSSIQPPSGCREAILAAVEKDKVVHLPKRRFPRAMWAAAAILFLTTAGLVKFFAFPPAVEFAQTPNPDVQTFREQMAYFADQRFVLDKFYKDNSKSAEWLAAKDYPSLADLPENLTEYGGMGCKKIDWNDREVGLICFKNEDNELVHLFVVNRAELEANPAHEAEFDKVLVFHDRETKGWSDDKNSYVLVGSEPGVKIGNIL